MRIQTVYTRALNLVKNLDPVDFYNLLESLEKGYEAYHYLELPDVTDDIEDIEDELDD